MRNAEPVAPRPRRNQPSALPTPDRRDAGSPLAAIAGGMTDPTDSWKEASNSTSGDPTSRTSAAKAMAFAAEKGRRRINPPKPTRAIHAARAVATASPVTSA